MTSAGCSANLRPNSMQPGSGRRFSWSEAPRLRVEADAEDIALLYHEVGYHTVEEGLALVERSYPGRPIAAKVQFLLEEIVESLDAE
jgi:hypothetical protein